MIFTKRSMSWVIIFFAMLARVESNLLGMQLEEEPFKFVCFRLDGDRIIKTFCAQNMEYALTPAHFIGQDFTDRLFEDEKKSVAQAFNQAKETGKSLLIQYALNDKEYEADVIPLFDLNGFSEFNVFAKEVACSSDEQSPESSSSDKSNID